MHRSSSQRQPSQGGEPPGLNDRYRSLANSFHRVAKQKDEQLKQAEREVQELRAQLEIAKQQQLQQQQQHPVGHMPYPMRQAAPHGYSQQPAPQSSSSAFTAQNTFNGRRTNDMVLGPDQAYSGAAVAGYAPQAWGYGAPSSEVGRAAADSAPSAPGATGGHSSSADGASKATRMGKLLSISSKLLSIKPKKAAEDGQQQQPQQQTAPNVAHGAAGKHDLFAAPNPEPAAHQLTPSRSAASAHPAGAPVREVPPQHRLWDTNALPSAPPPTLYPPPPSANPPPRPSYYASCMMSAAAAAAAHGHRWQQAASAARSVNPTPRAEPAPPPQQPAAPPPPAAPVPVAPAVGLQHPWAPLQHSGQTVGLAVTLPSAYLQAAPVPQPAAASKWQKAAVARVQQSQQQQEGRTASVAAIAKAVHGSDLAPGRYGSSGVDLFAPSALAKLRQQQQQQQAASGVPDGPGAVDGREGRAPDAAAALVSSALLGVGTGSSSMQDAAQGDAQSAPPAAGQANQPHAKGVSEGGNVWAQLIQRSNVGQVTQRLAASTPGSRRATDSTGVGSHGGAAGQPQQPPAQRLQPQQSIGGHSVASTRLTSWGSGEGVDALAGAPQGGQSSASRAQGAPPSASLRAAAAQLSQLPPRGKPPVPGSHRSASNAGSIATTVAPPSPHSPAPKPQTFCTAGAPSMPAGAHVSGHETAATTAPSPYAPSAPPLDAAAGTANKSPTAAAVAGQSASHPDVASNAYLVSILTRLATPQVLRQSGNDMSAHRWALGQIAGQGTTVTAVASAPPASSGSVPVGQGVAVSGGASALPATSASVAFGQAAVMVEPGALQEPPVQRAAAAVPSVAPDAESGVASTEAQTTFRRDFARRAGLAWRQKACYANAAPAAGFMERTVSMRGSGAGVTQETTGGALQQHDAPPSSNHYEVAGAPRAPATQVERSREPRPTIGGEGWGASPGSVQEPAVRAALQPTNLQAAPQGAFQASPGAAALQAGPQGALQAARQNSAQQAASMGTAAAGSVSLVRAAALWRLRSPRAAIGVSPRLLEAQRAQLDAPPQQDVPSVWPAQAAPGSVIGVTDTRSATAFALSSTPPVSEALPVHREQSPALGTGSPGVTHSARRSPGQEVQEGSPGLTRYGSADVCDFELTDSAASNSPAVATAAADVIGHLAANMTPCFPGIAMAAQAGLPTPLLGAQAAVAALSAAAGAPSGGDAATPGEDLGPTQMAGAQPQQPQITSPRDLQQRALDCSPCSSVGSWQPPNIGSPRPHCSITRGATGPLTSPRRLAKPVLGSPAAAERGFDAASTTVTPCAKLSGLGGGGAAAAAAIASAAAANVAFGSTRDTVMETGLARVGASEEEPGQLEHVPRLQSGSPDATVYGSAVGGQQINPGLYCSPGPRHATSGFDSAREAAAGAATPEDQATPTFWLPPMVGMSPVQQQERAAEASPSRFVASSVYESPVESAEAVPSATFMPRSVQADAGGGHPRMQSLDDACTVDEVVMLQQQQQRLLEALRLEQAATNIQAAWRGYCARVAVAERVRQQREEEQVERLRLEMEAQAERARKEAAAVVVQSAWRGRSARVAVAEMVRQQREGEAQREREEAAAVMVQAAWRGHCARVAVADMAREQKEAEEAQRSRREEAAAVVVQAAWRGHSARVTVAEMVRQQQAEQEEQRLKLEAQRKREEAAAVVVQAAWRGHCARVAVGEMVRRRRMEAAAQREQAAAVVVQAAWRGHQARAAVAALVRQRQAEEEQLQKQKLEMVLQAQAQREREEAAAVVMQAAWRGYSARVAVAEVVRKRREEQVALAQREREQAAAVVLQAAWRGHCARTVVAGMARQRREEEDMQRRQRLELQAQREREEAAAVVLQSAWRGHCARASVAEMVKQQREEEEAQRERMEAAAVVVQSAWRGYTARGAVADIRQRQAEAAEQQRRQQLEMELAAKEERREAAAVVVQSAWRGHCARVAVADMVRQRQAQTAAEEQRQQLELRAQAQREREEGAATVVQAAWRGHRARVAVAEMVSAQQQQHGAVMRSDSVNTEASGSMQGVALPLFAEEVPIGVRVPQLGLHRRTANVRDYESSPPIVSEGRVTTLISEGISVRFPAAGPQAPSSPDPSCPALAFEPATFNYGSLPAPASPHSPAAALPAHRHTPHTSTPAPNSGSRAGSDSDEYDSEPEVQGQEHPLYASAAAGSAAPFSAAPQGTPQLVAVPALTRAAGDSDRSTNSAASLSPSMGSALASWGMRAAAPVSPGRSGVDRGSLGGAGTPRWCGVGHADSGLESEESEDGVTMFLKTLVDLAHLAASGQIAPDDPQLMPLNEVLSDPSPAGAYLRDQLGVLLVQQGLGAGEQQEVGALGGEAGVGGQGRAAVEGEEGLECSSRGSGGRDGLGEEACSTPVGMGVMGVLGEEDKDDDGDDDGAGDEGEDGDDGEGEVQPRGAAARQLNRFALLCGSEEEDDDEEGQSADGEGQSADGEGGTDAEDDDGHSDGEGSDAQEPNPVETDEPHEGELLDGGKGDGEANGGDMAVAAGGLQGNSVVHETPQAPPPACPRPAPMSPAASSTPFSFGVGGLFGGALPAAAGGGSATPTWPGSAVGGLGSTVAAGSLPPLGDLGAGLGGGQPLFGAVGGLGTAAGQGAAQQPQQAGLFGGGGTFSAPLFGGTGAWGGLALQGSQAAPAFGAYGNIFGPPATPIAFTGAAGGSTSTEAPGPAHSTLPATFAFGSPAFPAASATPIFGANTAVPADASSPSVEAQSAHSTPHESSPNGAGATSYNTSSVFVSALGDSQAPSHPPGAPGVPPVAPTPMSRPRPQPTSSDTFISYNNSNTTTLMYGLPYGSGTAAPGAWGGIGLVTGGSWAGGVGASGSAAEQQQPVVPEDRAQGDEGTPPRHMRATSSPSVNGQPTGTPGGVEAGRAWPATARTEGYRTNQQQVLPYGGETPCSHRVGGMWGAAGAALAAGTGVQNGPTGHDGALPFRLSESEDGESEGNASDTEQGGGGTGMAAPWRPAGLPTMRLFDDDESEGAAGEKEEGEEEDEDEEEEEGADVVARGGRFALLGAAFGDEDSEGDEAEESAMEEDGEEPEEKGDASGAPVDGIADRCRTPNAGVVGRSNSGLGEAEGDEEEGEDDDDEAEAGSGFAGPVTSGRGRFALLCSEQSASEGEGDAQSQGEDGDGGAAGEVSGDEGGEAEGEREDEVEVQEAGLEWWRRHGGGARYGGGGGGDRSEGEGREEDEAFCSVATSVNDFGSACSSRRVSEGSSGRPQG